MEVLRRRVFAFESTPSLDFVVRWNSLAVTMRTLFP